jgi:hypothetical protein
MNDREIESVHGRLRALYVGRASAKENRIGIKLGGAVAVIHFSTRALRDVMVRSLSHLLVDDAPHPSLTIFCLDGDLADQNFFFPWNAGDFEVQGVIKGFNSDRFQAQYQHGSGAVMLYDQERREGIYHIEDSTYIPYWEISFPFRTLFHWWSRDTSYQLLHAGGIGTSLNAVIIAGKSGSGKSSTCLSAVLNPDLLIAGDDYVLVDTIDGMMYSLYQCAKVALENLGRLPFLKHLVDKNFDRAEKAMIFIHEKLPGKMLLRSNPGFLCIAIIGENSKSTIVACDPSEALTRMAPTTLFQLPLMRQEAFVKCVALVRKLSVFKIILGPDPREISDTIGDFLGRRKTLHP